MSGTSGDGVDASIIKSDGISSLEVIFDNFFEYDISIYDNIHKLKDKINNRKNITDLRRRSEIIGKRNHVISRKGSEKSFRKQNSRFNWFSWSNYLS